MALFSFQEHGKVAVPLRFVCLVVCSSGATRDFGAAPVPSVFLCGDGTYLYAMAQGKADSVILRYAGDFPFATT